MNELPELLTIDAIVRVDKLPAKGRRLKVVATPEQCLELAKLMQVSRVERFSANVVASSFRGGIRVLGPLEADIVQPCVATHEPVSQFIKEIVDRIFLPASKREKIEADAEIFIEAEGEDAPDYYDGTELDLTDLLLEIFALAIDPYPRKEGADIENLLKPADQDELLSPFAKLKALKTSSD